MCGFETSSFFCYVRPSNLFSSSLWIKVFTISSRNKKWFPTGRENEQTNLQRAGAESLFLKSSKRKSDQGKTDHFDLFVKWECCSTTCLLNIGIDVVMQIRNDFDRMAYQAQNEHLAARIETTNARRQNGVDNPRTVIRYYTTGNANQKLQICKRAFMKIYGVGKKRLRVLLKKRRPFSGAVEKDRRVLQSNQKRLSPQLKAEVC